MPSPLDSSITVDQSRNILIQTFGENIQIKRLEIIKKDEDASYGVYSHMGGKIVAIVELKGDGKEKQDSARDIAMHVAAENPDYISPEDIPEEVRQKEKEIAKSQIKDKPEHIVDKIVEGKMKAYFDQACLLEQKYIKDSTITIKEFVEKIGEGKELMILRFWRWQINQSTK